jgi:hypothetical protein
MDTIEITIDIANKYQLFEKRRLQYDIFDGVMMKTKWTEEAVVEFKRLQAERYKDVHKQKYLEKKDDILKNAKEKYHYLNPESRYNQKKDEKTISYYLARRLKSKKLEEMQKNKIHSLEPVSLGAERCSLEPVSLIVSSNSFSFKSVDPFDFDKLNLGSM